MQDGIKILKCYSKIFDTIIIPLDDIYSLNDNLQDKAFDSALKKSLELKGMINPILVCTDKDFKQTDISIFERRPVEKEISQNYRCLIGNNRYKYAIENGYTHIECFAVKTLEEVKAAHRKTQIEPRRF